MPAGCPSSMMEPCRISLRPTRARAQPRPTSCRRLQPLFPPPRPRSPPVPSSRSTGPPVRSPESTSTFPADSRLRSWRRPAPASRRCCTSSQAWCFLIPAPSACSRTRLSTSTSPPSLPISAPDCAASGSGSSSSRDSSCRSSLQRRTSQSPRCSPVPPAPRPPPLPGTGWQAWASRSTPTSGSASCPAVRRSVSRSLAPRSPNPRSSSPMSPPARSIPTPLPWSLVCSTRPRWVVAAPSSW